MSKRAITLEERVDAFKEFMGEHVSPEMVEQFKVMGFFTAPASTKYHGNYPGGLFDHSILVADELVNISKRMGLIWQKGRSPYIVGMFHDLCKVDAYEKDESRYIYREDSSFPGHGAKSVLILSQFMQLTEEEVFCIRYHMGAYEKDEWEYFGNAIKRYHNVLWTHTADMIASKIYNT